MRRDGQGSTQTNFKEFGLCLLEKKTMVFPVVMYGYESWTIKKAKCQRIDAFELWCWRRLESPLDCKVSNQSILKKISPEYSLKGHDKAEIPLFWPPDAKN